MIRTRLAQIRRMMEMVLDISEVRRTSTGMMGIQDLRNDGKKLCRTNGGTLVCPVHVFQFDLCPVVFVLESFANAWFPNDCRILQ